MSEATDYTLSDLARIPRKPTYELVRPRMPEVEQALAHGWTLQQVADGLTNEGGYGTVSRNFIHYARRRYLAERRGIEQPNDRLQSVRGSPTGGAPRVQKPPKKPTDQGDEEPAKGGGVRYGKRTGSAFRYTKDKSLSGGQQ